MQNFKYSLAISWLDSIAAYCFLEDFSSTSSQKLLLSFLPISQHTLDYGQPISVVNMTVWPLSLIGLQVLQPGGFAEVSSGSPAERRSTEVSFPRRLTLSWIPHSVQMPSERGGGWGRKGGNHVTCTWVPGAATFCSHKPQSIRIIFLITVTKDLTKANSGRDGLFDCTLNVWECRLLLITEKL